MTDTKHPQEYQSIYERVEVVGDGDMLCARFHDFANLQESPSGWGTTDAEAIAELAHEVEQERTRLAAEIERLQAIVDQLPNKEDG